MVENIVHPLFFACLKDILGIGLFSFYIHRFPKVFKIIYYFLAQSSSPKEKKPQEIKHCLLIKNAGPNFFFY